MHNLERGCRVSKIEGGELAFREGKFVKGKSGDILRSRRRAVRLLSPRVHCTPNLEVAAVQCERLLKTVQVLSPSHSGLTLGQPHYWSPMPPAALAVTAEGASCAARAVPSEGMQTTRTTLCVPADCFPDGVFRSKLLAASDHHQRTTTNNVGVSRVITLTTAAL